MLCLTEDKFHIIVLYVSDNKVDPILILTCDLISDYFQTGKVPTVPQIVIVARSTLCVSMTRASVRQATFTAEDRRLALNVILFLHLHEIVEGLYFHCSLSV